MFGIVEIQCVDFDLLHLSVISFVSFVVLFSFYSYWFSCVADNALGRTKKYIEGTLNQW